MRSGLGIGDGMEDRPPRSPPRHQRRRNRAVTQPVPAWKTDPAASKVVPKGWPVARLEADLARRDQAQAGGDGVEVFKREGACGWLTTTGRRNRPGGCPISTRRRRRSSTNTLTRCGSIPRPTSPGQTPNKSPTSPKEETRPLPERVPGLFCVCGGHPYLKKMSARAARTAKLDTAIVASRAISRIVTSR
jgi:hypothetical protein